MTVQAWARCLALVAMLSWAYSSAAGVAVVLEVNGAIGPATAGYLRAGFEHADEVEAAAMVITLDTPGGLDTSMRAIIRDVIASPRPVIVYVFPSGARAASAGTHILYAAHYAAMAPGTNLGAATPVQIGGVPDLDRPDPEPPVDVEDSAQDEADEGLNGDGKSADPMKSK